MVADKPGTPGQPTVIDVTSDSVTIVWNLPESDGGVPISNYVVEKRDVSSTKGWMIASKQMVRAPPFTVEPLSTGTYEFRVSAENELGLGLPSEPSEQVTVSEKAGLWWPYNF